jgi:Pyruvate/2-oxoacid:ferredoxin oxidoreductase delta subunit
MICTFCHNKGIPAPHNHTVRHWTMPNRPIICPELLSTKCINCNLMGHTVLYCPTKKSNQTDDEKHKKRNFNFLDCEDRKSKYQKIN